MLLFFLLAALKAALVFILIIVMPIVASLNIISLPLICDGVAMV